MTPFVLRARRLLPKDTEPNSDQFYDAFRQLWVHRSSGAIAVEEMRYRPAASKFGETTLTETREGADPAGSTLSVSDVDKEHHVGDDRQSFLASKFGETTHTATLEGTDQNREQDVFLSKFGETTMTKAPGEGADQTEIVAGLPYLPSMIQ